MAFDGRTRAIIVSSLILIVGIIHLGLGIGVCAQFHKYHDIFQQQIGLAAFDLVIGLFTITIGIFGLVSVLKEYPALCKYISFSLYRTIQINEANLL
jgi:hypothetical protein